LAFSKPVTRLKLRKGGQHASTSCNARRFRGLHAARGKYLGKEADYFKSGVLQYDGHPATQVVIARFDRFGGGEHRKSDYEVLSDWSDIEEMIAKFCRAGHPEALALQQAVSLPKG
jgi:hypothetical protein